MGAAGPDCVHPAPVSQLQLRSTAILPVRVIYYSGSSKIISVSATISFHLIKIGIIYQAGFALQQRVKDGLASEPSLSTPSIPPLIITPAGILTRPNEAASGRLNTDSTRLQQDTFPCYYSVTFCWDLRDMYRVIRAAVNRPHLPLAEQSTTKGLTRLSG